MPDHVGQIVTISHRFAGWRWFIRPLLHVSARERARRLSLEWIVRRWTERARSHRSCATVRRRQPEPEKGAVIRIDRTWFAVKRKIKKARGEYST